MNPQDVKEQLGLLRELTRRTGVLHEAQVLQLSYWVRIMVDNSTDAVILPELDVNDQLAAITFDVTTEGRDRPITELRERLVHLDEHVKFLLGSQIATKVKLNGKLMVEYGPRASL